MTRISVVVPFYNAERYIARCIQGLLSQRYPPDRYEIVVIDNNSTDASAEIVRRHPRVRLTCERKTGPYAARNTGVAQAHGEIIAFTDPDCVPASDWLPRIESAMADPEVGIVLGSHAFDGGSPLLSMLADYENEKKDYVFRRGETALYYGHANNMAVRRRLFDQEGPFLEAQRGADTAFVRRCAERHSGRVVRYRDDVRVRHLEIDCVATYLRKVFIYGQSSRRFGPGVYAQPLANRDRFRIFASAVRRRRYAPARAGALLALLLVGLGCWTLGRVSVWLGPRPAPPVRPDLVRNR
jgi:glycosyltransferase involved in cell wall biosynthesis